jgi:hypothetical protein
MKMGCQRELFEPAKRITPPKPDIPRDDPRQMDLVAWIAEHPADLGERRSSE